MKYSILGLSLMSALTAVAIASTGAIKNVDDEASLYAAISAANSNRGISTITSKHNAEIQLTAAVIYTGAQQLKLVGNKATIDGPNAGSFVLNENLTASTAEEAGEVKINKVTLSGNGSGDEIATNNVPLE